MSSGRPSTHPPSSPQRPTHRPQSRPLFNRRPPTNHLHDKTAPPTPLVLAHKHGSILLPPSSRETASPPGPHSPGTSTASPVPIAKPQFHQPYHPVLQSGPCDVDADEAVPAGPDDEARAGEGAAGAEGVGSDLV
ncbi:hypothetical protein FPV67DRAFT_1671133 [Lyophyllum atratum]|nr:hypothetical protein FPV67DRAFT_1671133 [Lyophyllum atratum]